MGFFLLTMKTTEDMPSLVSVYWSRRMKLGTRSFKLSARV